MDCPGLSGVWRACPPSIPGLTSVERDVFGTLGGPLMLVVIVSIAAIMTVVAFSLTDGLGIGSSLRPRRWARSRRMDAARRHNGRAPHLRLVERAAQRHRARAQALIRSTVATRGFLDQPDPARRSTMPTAGPLLTATRAGIAEARAHIPTVLASIAAARIHLHRSTRLAVRRLRPAVAQVADVVAASADVVAASAGALAASAGSAAASIAAVGPVVLDPPMATGAGPDRPVRRLGRRRVSEAPIRARARARTARRGSRSAAAPGRSPGSRAET